MGLFVLAMVTKGNVFFLRVGSRKDRLFELDTKNAGPVGTKFCRLVLDTRQTGVFEAGVH